MRRDAIIRLQLLLPIIRTEIARIDFTPEYVLLVDRYHKEYIKASYKEVSFLADNGISFYSLQSLFWNELFLPGQKKIADNQLKQFDCDIASVGTTVPIEFHNKAIDYQWTANRAIVAHLELCQLQVNIWQVVSSYSAVCRTNQYRRQSTIGTNKRQDVVAKDHIRLGHRN